jgi:endonuclease/exonuclease/phosphatase family metal-dependent hydrolase
MRPGRPSSPPSQIARGFPRAIFCVAAALLLGACREQAGTPAWDTPGDPPPPPAAAAPVAAPPRQAAPAPAAAADQPGLRFASYNVENWLTMNRRPLGEASKPEEEKQAVITLLTRHQPDVVGLSEIGTTEDLAEIQALLKQAGLDLPHSFHAGGSDPVRHLGLLSRFPITSTATPARLDYQLEDPASGRPGRLMGFNRGILDATVSAGSRSYRFLGVHLKSKREVGEGDQEAMRLAEARLLREHVDAILDGDPDARLVVYGDFNDSRVSATGRAITGNYNDPGYLTAVRARDSRGHSWTHFWELHEIYSRIDFVTVSRALRREVDFPGSYIIDDEEWEKASDHRPILVIFR